MTYYTLEVDIKTPIRQQITVPTGNDFAVVVYTLVNGHKAKYYHGSGSQIISETSWTFPSDQISNLIDSSAYKLSPAVFGEDAYMTLFFKGSDTAGSKQTYFTCSGLNLFNDEGVKVSTENYNPKIQFTLNIVFVEQAKNCDGPDYNLQIAGNVQSKAAELNGLSVVYKPKNQGGMPDVLNINQNKAMINGHLTEKYSMAGMQMNNNNGFFELSGNICFDQDMTSNAKMSNAQNVFFLDHFSKYVKVAELSVGEQVLSVLQVLPVN